MKLNETQTSSLAEAVDRIKKKRSIRRLLPKDTYWTLIQKYQERALDRKLGLDWLTKKEKDIEYAERKKVLRMPATRSRSSSAKRRPR